MPKQGTATKSRTMGIRKRQRDSGTRWEARWREENGTERARSFLTEDEAKAHLEDVRHGLRRGTYVSPVRSRTPLRTVAEAWLGVAERKPRTMESYRLLIDKWLGPWLDRPVGSISYGDVTGLIAQMRDAGRKPQSIRNVVNVLNGVMEHAVADGLIVVNPVRRVKATKGTIPKAVSDARHPLTAAEVGALAAQVPPAYGLALRFAAWSGLRAGEIAGLRVQALDPLRHEVRVEETVIRLVGGRWQGGTPKSARSRRRVPVPPSLMRELTEHVAARGLAPDAYLFGDDAGEPLNHPALYRRHFTPAAVVIKRPDLHFHDLRHTYASLMAPHITMLELSRRMGHSTYAITDKTYTHLYETDDPSKAAALDAMYTSAAAAPSNVVSITR
jgi:integrase